MSRRSTLVKITTKAGILFGALFLVTVLIAAIPAHQQKALELVITPEQHPSHDSAGRAQSSSSERGGVNALTPGHHEAHRHQRHLSTMHDRALDDVARTHQN
jgi:hypothetical protein